MTEDRIWLLMARRLAGEASEEALKELEKLIEENPGITYQLETILNYWSHTKNITKEQDNEALRKLLARIKERETSDEAVLIREYENRKLNFMFRNYFKTAWRTLVRGKGYSAINIGGLAIGMAVAALIGLWVHDELTFNKYHKNYDHIAQVMQHGNFNGEWDSQTANPGVMGPEIRAKHGSDFAYVVQSSWPESHLFSIGDKHFLKRGNFFEPDAPEMLTLNMLKGTRAGLKDPYSIMLSASTAEALFGKEDPLHKTLRFEKERDVIITGVYEDLPANTTFSFLEFIMPWDMWLIRNPWAKEMANPWGNNFSQTFVQIADNADYGCCVGKN